MGRVSNWASVLGHGDLVNILWLCKWLDGYKFTQLNSFIESNEKKGKYIILSRTVQLKIILSHVDHEIK